jgi:hypothetical protein
MRVKSYAKPLCLKTKVTPNGESKTPASGMSDIEIFINYEDNTFLRLTAVKQKNEKLPVLRGCECPCEDILSCPSVTAG